MIIAGVLDSKLLLPLPLLLMLFDAVVLSAQLMCISVLSLSVRHTEPLSGGEVALAVLCLACASYFLLREAVQAVSMHRWSSFQVAIYSMCMRLCVCMWVVHVYHAYALGVCTYPCCNCVASLSPLRLLRFASGHCTRLMEHARLHLWRLHRGHLIDLTHMAVASGTNALRSALGCRSMAHMGQGACDD